MVKKTLISILSLIVVSCFAANTFAEELTAQLCKEKVIAAAKLIETAFAKIKDPNGDFRFGNGSGYVWIHNMDATMIMHPTAPSLNGKDLSGLQDKNGVLFFMAFNEVVEEHGQGWVEYQWPKPKAEVTSPKVSFVRLAKYNGEEYVVGAGMYDVTKADIKKLFPKDAIYED